MFPESSCRVTPDGVVGLTRAFLAAGVQCVCVSLWPVPVAASKLFTHAFYTALLNGTKVSAALTEAMKTLQSSKHFSHPSNWAGERTVLFLESLQTQMFSCTFCWPSEPTR